MKVAITLVEGFEIVEAMAPVDMLRRANINIDILSVFNTEFVNSAQNVQVRCDKNLSDANLDEYDLIILPGGAGTKNYYDSELLLNAIKKQYESNKYLAGICAAPSVFANLGLLEDKHATSFPTFTQYLIDGKAKLIEDKKVVIDSKIITARGASASIEFGLTLVEILLGKEKRKEIETSIVY